MGSSAVKQRFPCWSWPMPFSREGRPLLGSQPHLEKKGKDPHEPPFLCGLGERSEEPLLYQLSAVEELSDLHPLPRSTLLCEGGFQEEEFLDVFPEIAHLPSPCGQGMPCPMHLVRRRSFGSEDDHWQTRGDLPRDGRKSSRRSRKPFLTGMRPSISVSILIPHRPDYYLRLFSRIREEKIQDGMFLRILRTSQRSILSNPLRRPFRDRNRSSPFHRTWVLSGQEGFIRDMPIPIRP